MIRQNFQDDKATDATGPHRLDIIGWKINPVIRAVADKYLARANVQFQACADLKASATAPLTKDPALPGWRPSCEHITDSQDCHIKAGIYASGVYRCRARFALAACTGVEPGLR